MSHQTICRFLFERSLVEREMNMKFAQVPGNYDIRTQLIPVTKITKVSKIYFKNISGSGPNASLSADNLAKHFVSQLIKGAQETQE